MSYKEQHAISQVWHALDANLPNIARRVADLLAMTDPSLGQLEKEDGLTLVNTRLYDLEQYARNIRAEVEVYAPFNPNVPPVGRYPRGLPAIDGSEVALAAIREKMLSGDFKHERAVGKVDYFTDKVMMYFGLRHLAANYAAVWEIATSILAGEELL